MSSKITKFLTDWLRWHTAGRIGSPEDIPQLVSKCLSDASREGIFQVDLELAIGSLEECIRQSLLKVEE